jgi:hypothetical protein
MHGYLLSVIQSTNVNHIYLNLTKVITLGIPSYVTLDDNNILTMVGGTVTASAITTANSLRYRKKKQSRVMVKQLLFSWTNEMFPLHY